MNQVFDFQGKTALITGGSRGIGFETASAFYACGAKVILVASTLANAEKASREISNTAGTGSVAPMAANFADKAEIEKLLQQIEGEKVDFFIHSAGVTQDNLLIRMTDAEWEQVLAVNLSSTFYFTRALAKSMMKNRFGRIVLISSVVGFSGNPGQANYSATKAALAGFAKSVAQELASRNLLINLVAPGFIDTDMTKSLKDEHKTELLKQIPMRRMGTAKEVASGALFLCSHLADYVTGTVLHINGGMY